MDSKKSLQKNIESVSMLMPPLDPNPPTVSALGYFYSQHFLDLWGCLVRCEIDFVTFWVNFDQNNVKREGQNLTK